jgi:hypothetical protein
VTTCVRRYFLPSVPSRAPLVCSRRASSCGPESVTSVGSGGGFVAPDLAVLLVVDDTKQLPRDLILGRRPSLRVGLEPPPLGDSVSDVLDGCSFSEMSIASFSNLEISEESRRSLRFFHRSPITALGGFGLVPCSAPPESCPNGAPRDPGVKCRLALTRRQGCAHWLRALERRDGEALRGERASRAVTESR